MKGDGERLVHRVCCGVQSMEIGILWCMDLAR
jgi:hypothetical protein